jgi:hypothetical protein
MANSTPSTARRQRRKPDRFARLSSDPATLSTTLTIRQVSATGKETVDTYVLDEIGSGEQDGRGFSLTKPDGTVYHCELTATVKHCDCPGFTRWQHCKHTDALVALIGKGKLPAPVCEPVRKAS